MSKSLYLCDNRFHTEILREQVFSNNSKIGFVIIDGHSVCFYLLVDNVKTILYKSTVDLPKKHNNGGQSQNRFARIRDEKRGWYISQSVEAFNRFFTTEGCLNVSHLIFGGCADFKHELAKKLEKSYSDKIIGFLDLQYGGDDGFNQALELSTTLLKDTKLVREKHVVGEFFELIRRNGNYCYSVAETIMYLEMGLVKTLIVSYDLPDKRYETINDNNEKSIIYKFDPSCKIIKETLLLDWILENYMNYGAELELVSPTSSIGNQFISSFGGIGGILSYKIDTEFLNVNIEEEEEYIYPEIISGNQQNQI